MVRFFKKIRDAFKRAKDEKKAGPTITISGAGVMSVKSSEVIQTEEAKRQIRTIIRMKEAGILNTR